ncbi:integrase arm-type DNA-binding domain-containing protein, partial [Rhabdaerophilum sp.]|uniref:integrase arm-type DNA-binding domain-containing protein n=1 Tax=Rhabdaerophilum sp. TaxID=2717341 RepID=UPI0038D45315
MAMPTVKLTKSAVDDLPPGASLWDQAVRGFGVRRQSLDPVFIVKARVNGRQRFLTIGRHGSPWTVETARNEARRLLGEIASG